MSAIDTMSPAPTAFADVAAALAVLDASLLQRVDALAQPIAPDAPCGVSLRHDPAWDEIREARRQDAADIPTGIWQSTLKTADWAQVEQRASALLSSRSKDLMLAGWLGEAWLQRYGVQGIAATCALLLRWMDAWWDALHPQAVDGDQSWRASPLEWCLRTWAETLQGGMALPGQRGGAPGAQATLSQYLAWQKQRTPATDSRPAKAAAEVAQQALQQVQTAVKAGSWAELHTQWQHTLAARYLLRALDARSADLLGAEGPAFGGLYHVLDQLDAVQREFMSWLPAPAPAPGPAPVSAADPPADVSGDPSMSEPSAPGGTDVATIAQRAAVVAHSRDDAYRQLQAIADYLARTEPHSPVPYLIYRAVEWGNKPLPALLGELLAGDAEARRLWSLLGVLP